MELKTKILVSPTQVKLYEDAIREHLMELSPNDRYLRFFGSSQAQLEYWLNKITTTGATKHTIVLILAGEKVIGVGDLAYVVNSEEGEAAISTLKEYRKELFQGQRLGVALIQILLDVAQELKLSTIVYSTLPENVSMLNLGKSMGFKHKWVDGAIKGIYHISEN